jgi:hypothetical protein
MLWDLLQQRQIGKARQSAAEAASTANRTQQGVDELERVVESLMLTCQAMWELLREQGKLSDEMLLKRMQEVDLRDGKQDGKMGGHALTCPACSRQNNMRHDRCMYCGTLLPPPQHIFA